MQNHELFENIRHLLKSQVQCVLATLEGEQPCQHLMAYAFNDSLSKLYLASYADTRKTRNMVAQPCVSLLWDNRTGNSEDHVQGLALNATGRAELLTGDQRAKAMHRLLERNASLTSLLAAEACAIFAVAVTSYTFVRGYSEVYQYLPDPD